MIEISNFILNNATIRFNDAEIKQTHGTIKIVLVLKTTFLSEGVRKGCHSPLHLPLP